MKRYFVFILLFSNVCYSQSKKSISAAYSSYFADTQWFYFFEDNNTYLYWVTGHLEGSKTRGKYSISGDTIFLEPFEKNLQEDSFFHKEKTMVFQDGDSCIIDAFTPHHDYCKQKNSEMQMGRIRIIKTTARKDDRQ